MHGMDAWLLLFRMHLSISSLRWPQTAENGQFQRTVAMREGYRLLLHDDTQVLICVDPNFIFNPVLSAFKTRDREISLDNIFGIRTGNGRLQAVYIAPPYILESMQRLGGTYIPICGQPA